MNRKQTIVAWIGVAVFVFFALNPKIVKVAWTPTVTEHKSVFDTGFTAMFGRLSSTVVVTSLAIYTLRDKKQARRPE